MNSFTNKHCANKHETNKNANKSLIIHTNVRHATTHPMLYLPLRPHLHDWSHPAIPSVSFPATNGCVNHARCFREQLLRSTAVTPLTRTSITLVQPRCPNMYVKRFFLETDMDRPRHNTETTNNTWKTKTGTQKQQQINYPHVVQLTCYSAAARSEEHEVTSLCCTRHHCGTLWTKGAQLTRRLPEPLFSFLILILIYYHLISTTQQVSPSYCPQQHMGNAAKQHIPSAADKSHHIIPTVSTKVHIPSYHAPPAYQIKCY